MKQLFNKHTAFHFVAVIIWIAVLYTAVKLTISQGYRVIGDEYMQRIFYGLSDAYVYLPIFALLAVGIGGVFLQRYKIGYRIYWIVCILVVTPLAVLFTRVNGIWLFRALTIIIKILKSGIL